MTPKLKLTMLASSSALIVAAASLAVLIADVVPAYARIVGTAAMDPNAYPNAGVTKAFSFGGPQVGSRSTGESIEAWRRSVARLDDKLPGLACVSVEQSRDCGRDTTGHGSVSGNLDDPNGERCIVPGHMTVRRRS